MRRLLLAGFLTSSIVGCVESGDHQEDANDSFGSVSDALSKTGDGISTCGPTHAEACATKIPVKISDTKTILLGKFDITAGRFRDFVTSTHGDMRSYVSGHEPAWWNGPWRAQLSARRPSGLGNLWGDVGGYGYDWTVWLPSSKDDLGYLVGPWNFGVAAGDLAATGAGGYSGQSDGAKPFVDSSMYGPGNEGCAVADYGARTYWQPNGATGGDDNRYGQSVLDKKALNCTSFYLLAAFCAWDGGRLPTNAELDAAWGGETYPWGETTPYYADFDGKVVADGPKDLANYGNSAGTVYQSPAQVGLDLSNHLSSPGEFPRGYGPYGHADLSGLLIGITGDIAQATATEKDENSGSTVTVAHAPVVSWHRGGSWQGHTVTSSSTFRFIASNRYIAAGARCAYDAGAPAASAFPNGYRAEYFAGTALATSKGVRVDPFIAFSSSNFANPAASNANTPYSARWSAALKPRYSETYTFKTVAGDGIRVWVDGTKIIDDWTSHSAATKTGTIALAAGKSVSIKIEHYNASGKGVASKVLWSSKTQLEQAIPASVLTPSAP